MMTKPKFYTKLHKGKLVPVAVEPMPGLYYRKESIEGLDTVVLVWLNDAIIYRNEDYFWMPII